MSDGIAEKIVERAKALGYERCGIVRVDALKGYGEAVKRRMERFPEMKSPMSFLLSFADPSEKFPWARSVVICSRSYWDYRVPSNLGGIIGKAYLFDDRRDELSYGYRDRALLEKYMSEELGLTTTKSDAPPPVPYRWAAAVAGIGTIRRNNFFYGDRGSYYGLTAFLIDLDLEYIHASEADPCPENCDLCVKNCPTHSLAEPFAMNSRICVSYLTTLDLSDGVYEEHGEEIGGWAYGCDVCQDVCPRNRGRMSGERDFPGLEELSGELSIEGIVSMDGEKLKNLVAKKFWYINGKDIWKWRCNALNVMRNNFDERYIPAITSACLDEDDRVRGMAQKIRTETFASS
ncbi:MAG: hypothetical protein LBT08_10160 [Synergistaceae bacterium]|jgi:epoxyqueuosine reductase|nr:hypothetical protein [Synergistaceae bacterium]